MGAPRTPAQNRRLHGLKGQLTRGGLAADDADEMVRALAMEASGQEHTSRLTEGQAAQVIRQLEIRVQELAPTPTPRAPQAEAKQHVPWGERGQASRDVAPLEPRQLEVIGHLCTDAGLSTLPQRVGFFRRQLQGRARPETQKDADALVEPLKAMILRKVSVAEICARVAKVQGRGEQLDAWQKGFIADLAEQLAVKGKKALSPNKLYRLTEAEARCNLRG